MSGRSAREGALSGRAVRAGSRLARAALPLVLLAMWSTAAQADGLSLFPARDPAALLSAFDGAGSSEPRLALAQWRPYGLSGVDVLVATGSLGLGPLRVSAAYEEQDWGVLRGRCVRLGLHAAAGEALRLGLEVERESLAGAPALSDLRLLLSGGGALRLALRYRLGEGATPAGDERGLVGLALHRGAWTLRLFRGLGARTNLEEGVALDWERGPFTLRLLAGPAPWQGIELRLRRGRWGMAFRSRLHPALGSSHGVGLLVY